MVFFTYRLRKDIARKRQHGRRGTSQIYQTGKASERKCAEQLPIPLRKDSLDTCLSKKKKNYNMPLSTREG